MFTWKLWHALCHPPLRHPLFVRIVTAPPGGSLIRRTLKFTAIYLLACLLLTLAWPVILSNPPLVVLVSAASVNTIYSTLCAARIGSALAREREQATFDLICLMPMGALGAGWALSTAHLHRSALFRTLRLLLHSMAIALIGALLTIIPVTLTLASGSPASYELFMLLNYGGALVAAFYFDHIQSLTLAHLTGMITASVAKDRINARLWSTGVFLLLQLLIYLVTIIAAFVLLPALLRQLRMSEMAINMALPLLCLAIFYSLRELSIRLAWRFLAHQFNASTADQREILRTLVL